MPPKNKNKTSGKSKVDPEYAAKREKNNAVRIYSCKGNKFNNL